MNIRSGLATIGWGVYGASSWTWCIGMFLPLILLRAYGWPGFLAFALPNVLGAAAFGYVLGRPERSAAMTRAHRGAMRWFSIAAVAYQLYFAGYVLVRLGPGGSSGAWLAMGGAVGLFAAGWVLSRVPLRFWPLLAVLALLVSLTAWLAIGPDLVAQVSWTGSDPGAELPWLIPVLAFGFGLCPYLDLTFHRALQASPSRHAFSVFGVCFAMMLLVSATYSVGWSRGVSAIVAAHLMGQMLFTAAAHLRELRAQGGGEGAPGWTPAGLLPLLALPLILFAQPMLDRLEDGVYIRFLALYGLVFPAYVLVFIGPGRALTVGRSHLLVFATVILVCLPFYEVGFVGHRTWALIIPVAALLAWTIVQRSWWPGATDLVAPAGGGGADACGGGPPA